MRLGPAPPVCVRFENGNGVVAQVCLAHLKSRHKGKCYLSLALLAARKRRVQTFLLCGITALDQHKHTKSYLFVYWNLDLLVFI